MAVKVLFVKSDMNIISRFKELISPHISVFDVSYADSAKEAIAYFEKTVFDNIVTGLKIPKLSEGFLFLSRIKDKRIDCRKVIVVANNITHNLKQSMDSMGIYSLCRKDELDKVLQLLFKLNHIDPKTGQIVTSPEPIGHINLVKIKESLINVMGPFGKIIYDDVINRWKNQDKPEELIQLIKTELGDEKKIDLFKENI